MHRKKVAIFLGGRVKTTKYDVVIKNLKQFIELYDTTFFCSLNESAHEISSTERLCNDLNIKPECLNIEITKEPDILNTFSKRPESSFHRTWSMYYHNKRCFELIQSYQEKYKITFDAIVKYRGDISSNYPLIIVENINSNTTVYIPTGADWGGINDQVAYGNIASMEKYCKYSDFIIEYCGTDKVIFHPETLLKHHLSKCGLKVERINYSYELSK